MSEIGETPPQAEVQAEAPVVMKTKSAIDNMWEGMKDTNKEYWEVRKELQGRLDWHGGGIINMYVTQMDAVTDVLWGGKDRSWGARLMAMKDRIVTRLAGTFIGVSSAAFDLVYNAGSWPMRHFFPVFAPPKDIAKRFAVATTHTLTAKAAAEAGALIAAKVSTETAYKGQKAVGKAERAIAEAAVTAPEVAATMVKRRAEKALYNILHPQEVQKPAAK